MKPPSFLFASVDDDPGCGGMGRFARGLAEGIAEAGAEVTLLLPKGVGARGRLPEIRIPLPTTTWGRIRLFRHAIGTFVLNNPEKSDYVLCNSWSPMAIGALWAHMRVKEIRYGIVLHGNDLLEPARSWRWRLIMRNVLSRAEHLFVNSRATADCLRCLEIDHPRIVLLHPAVRDAGALAKIRREPDPRKKTILTVCRLVPRKGVDRVLAAVAELAREIPELQHHIVGDGPERLALEKQAEALGVAERVSFHGYVAEDQLRSLYGVADLFVMTPFERPEEGDVEGYGIVYREANAAGLPVIGTRSGGVAEAVDDGETGLLVPENSPDELKRALRRLLLDSGLRRRLGEEGRRRVLEHHTWKYRGQTVIRAVSSRL